MALKLAIQDVVNVPVRAVFNDGGQTRRFDFTLQCTRMATDPLAEAIRSEDKKTTEIMAEVTTGWSGQRLVLGDDGEPAPFSKEALGVMLSAPGLANLAFNAYLKEVGAREKN